MRRIVAWVEVDGQERLMTFSDQPPDWSAEQRGGIIFGAAGGSKSSFKQIKQTLQLADFLGTSTNAVRWQIWTGIVGLSLTQVPGFPLELGA